MKRVFLTFVGILATCAIANSEDAVNSLTHPMLSSPAGPISIGGEGGEYLVDGISNRAFFFLAAKWSTDADSVTRIPVCWENPKPEHEEKRKLVKNAVTSTWQVYSRIMFQNWGTCTPADDRAIKISVGDHWPQSFIGRQVSGKPSGLKLNFDFDAPSEWVYCKSIAESCIIKLAVHEFGHALGFMHEQARKDTPDQCIAAQPGEPVVSTSAPGFTTAGTPWDPESVMNYCNPVWNNNGHLSSLDKLALQKVYGAPRK